MATEDMEKKLTEYGKTQKTLQKVKFSASKATKASSSKRRSPTPEIILVSSPSKLCHLSSKEELDNVCDTDGLPWSILVLELTKL